MLQKLVVVPSNVSQLKTGVHKGKPIAVVLHDWQELFQNYAEIHDLPLKINIKVVSALVYWLEWEFFFWNSLTPTQLNMWVFRTAQEHMWKVLNALNNWENYNFESLEKCESIKVHLVQARYSSEQKIKKKANIDLLMIIMKIRITMRSATNTFPINVI